MVCANQSPPLWGGWIFKMQSILKRRVRCGTTVTFSPYVSANTKHFTAPHPSRLRRATFPKGEGWGAPAPVQHLDKSKFDYIKHKSPLLHSPRNEPGETNSVTIPRNLPGPSLSAATRRRVWVQGTGPANQNFNPFKPLWH